MTIITKQHRGTDKKEEKYEQVLTLFGIISYI